MCHPYVLQLVNTADAGAPAHAVGKLNSGSAFFTGGVSGDRDITHVHVQNVPVPFLTDTDYPATASNLHVPSNSKVFDCRPCTIGSVHPPPPRRSEGKGEEESDTEVAEVVEDHKPSPTTPPAHLAVYADFDKRAASSCTKPTSTTRATSTPEATRAASSHIAEAAAAAAAAAATDASAAAAAAAAAAVAAANALGPAAAALVSVRSYSQDIG